MNQRSFVVFCVIVLLALAACSVPPRSVPAPACDTSGDIPNIDDVGLSDGINTATNALTETNTTAPVKTPTPVKTPPVTTDANVIKKVVTEGDLVSFPNLKATSPDGLKVKYTFSKPLDSAGKWQTKVGDAGEYPVTIGATDGKSNIEQKILIIVQQANLPPVIKGPDTITAKEGENVALGQDITDPNGDKVVTSYSGWMTTDLKKTTDGDAGTHMVIVKASDGKLTTVKNITVIVQHVNRAPVINDIVPVTVKESETVTIKPVTSDPDGNPVVVTFDKPLDAAGSWTTKLGDAGTYNVKVTASDGQLSTSTVATITVTKMNRPPVISNFSDITVNEGDLVTLNPAVTDPEGDKVTLVYSGWMTSATKQTTYDDAQTNGGKEEVTLTVTDTAGNSVKKTITVTIKDVNRPPVFDPGSFS